MAQLNVGRLRAPLDDPIIDSPGYVWRQQDGSGNATNIKPGGFVDAQLGSERDICPA